jgi:hypothetical protein
MLLCRHATVLMHTTPVHRCYVATLSTPQHAPLLCNGCFSSLSPCRKNAHHSSVQSEYNDSQQTQVCNTHTTLQLHYCRSCYMYRKGCGVSHCLTSSALLLILFVVESSNSAFALPCGAMFVTTTVWQHNVQQLPHIAATYALLFLLYATAAVVHCCSDSSSTVHNAKTTLRCTLLLLLCISLALYTAPLPALQAALLRSCNKQLLLLLMPLLHTSKCSVRCCY